MSKNQDNLMVFSDTDSISITKQNGTPWTEEERKAFCEFINSEMPENIRWEDDGYYPKVLVVKSKNYVLSDGKKLTYRGGTFKDSKKEPIMKSLMEEITNTLLGSFNTTNLTDIYEKYIEKCYNIDNIKDWCQKKTITKSVLKCKGHESLTKEEKKEMKLRKNETDVWDAVKDIDGLQEGDKVYLYLACVSRQVEIIQFKNGRTREKVTEVRALKIHKNWNNDHAVDKLIERVYNTISIFSKVINTDIFVNYTLKKNQSELNRKYAKQT